MGKSLLIIGGAGYIGGVTAHMANEVGYAVTVVDNLSTGHRHNVPPAAFIKGDVCDRRFIESVFAKKFDAVMHFAAHIQVGESMKRPFDYFHNNSFGALNAIDAAASSGVGAYIFSSSAAIYGEPAHIPLTEDSPTTPVNPYGWSKLLTEQLLRSYRTTHNLHWAALRYFNVAGAYSGVGTEYPFLSHIIPALLDSMHKKEPFTINGKDYDTPDGTCIRDYVHVADIARAHLLAVEKMLGGTPIDQPINLGSHHGSSVKEVVDTFNKVTSAHVPIKYGPSRPGDPARLIASNHRAKQLLGWQPERDLRVMINDHYEWYTAKARSSAQGATII